MSRTRILIVDDEIKLVRSICFALRQAGYDCLQSHSGAQGLELAEKQAPDLVLLDVKMPGASGLDVLQALRQRQPDLPVIMMSALDATQDAVRAVKLGAVDYLSKPFDMEELIQIIEETTATIPPTPSAAHQENRRIEEAMLLGNSYVIATLRDQLDRVAASSSRCVMLRGEVGVGKAVVARELHLRTCGPDAPLVELNCATLAPGQAESELFGQDGASNGVLPRRGLIEIADGGTLFLHEVEALPLPVQTRLQTFLETGNLRPMASKSGPQADVRIVISTDADLEQATREGRLRRDLYLKLSALPLEVPPLRERSDDVDLLALRFCRDFARRAGQRPIQLDSGCLDRLRAYPWPGNVRELKNLTERLTILHPEAMIRESDLPSEYHDLTLPQAETIADQIQHVERDLIRDAMTKARGRKGVAAEKLGISRHALKRKIQKLGLQ